MDHRSFEEDSMQLPIALVWDSEPSIREDVEGALKQAGYATVLHAASAADLDTARGAGVSLIVAGAATPDAIPFDEIQAARRAWPGAAWAVMAGDGEQGAERAAREGALDLLSRPPRAERVRALAVRALEQARGAVEEGALVGRSAAIERLRREVHQIAERMTPVLIVGEPGSGRTQIARALHAAWGAPGVLEVAEASRPARRSGSGAVFVRDVERLPWEDQAALAGGRFVASTALDPAKASEEGRLHPALLAAVGDAVVRVPALREHREDVPLLVRSFVEGLRRINGLPPIALEAATIEVLQRHAWPGNVKELRDAVETAVILASDGVVRVRDLPEAVRGAEGPAPGIRADRRFRAAKRAVVDAFERAYLTDLLGRHRGNVTGAAEHSGMLRSALQRLLRKHDLRSVDFRRPGGAVHRDET